MRIGIDAMALPDRPVGAGNYIIQLIRCLASSAGCEELVIFIQRSRLPLLAVSENSRVRLVVVADKPVALRLLWEQTCFPILVKRLGLDLLHSPHYTMPLAHPCRCVVTFHDMSFFLFPGLHTLPKRILFPLIIRASARRSDAIIADSESTRQDAIRLLGSPPSKITTVHLGVTADYKPISDQARLESVRQEYHLPERFILYVGTVEPRKNLPSLLYAYQSLSERLPGWSLVIAGRLGWMYDAVMRLVKQLALSEQVYFTGYMPEVDLPALYNLADLVVYPSVYEGFGLPVLEAMACGVPVITTNVSSMPEIVADAGVLISPGDDPALAEAMKTLLTDPEKHRWFSEKGIQRAAAFTWEKTAQETLKVYQRVQGV